MTRDTTRIALAVLILAGISALTLGVTALGSVSATGETTDIGTTHPLADEDAIAEYQRDGFTGGELDRYQIRVEMSDSRDDVGLDPSIVSDFRNDYLRIEYREDHSRSLRFLIPREYVTPYTQESVDSLSTDHTASFSPARDRQYLEVVVNVNGPADIALPIERDASASYGVLERMDHRLEEVAGVSPLGRDAEWEYVEEDDLVAEAAVPIEGDPDDLLIQYDARSDDPEEYWLNAPEGEREGVDVYYFVRESDDDQVYIVAKGEEPTTVRYKTESTVGDRVEGWVNDARAVPDRITDGFDGLGLFSDD